MKVFKKTLPVLMAAMLLVPSFAVNAAELDPAKPDTKTEADTGGQDDIKKHIRWKNKHKSCTAYRQHCDLPLCMDSSSWAKNLRSAGGDGSNFVRQIYRHNQRERLLLGKSVLFRCKPGIQNKA